jgi:protein-tyrosine-phosphatase
MIRDQANHPTPDAVGTNDERETAGAQAGDEGSAEPAPRTTTFNILFVCTGNTCRSPLAEGIARAEIERRGWKNVEVASAGLAAMEGSPATAEAVTVAGRAGIGLDAHRSRRVTPAMVAWADLVLGMGHSHVHALDRLGAGDRAATLGDFAAGPEREGRPVADPFGGSEAVYQETFDELRELIAAVFDRLAPILAP